MKLLRSTVNCSLHGVEELVVEGVDFIISNYRRLLYQHLQRLPGDRLPEADPGEGEMFGPPSYEMGTETGLGIHSLKRTKRRRI